MEELNRAIAQARIQAQQVSTPSMQAEVTAKTGDAKEGKVEIPEKKKTDDEPHEVVKKVKVTSDYFNTLCDNDKEAGLIKAIIDENIKAVDGSRVRLRLLDDIVINEAVIHKGSYIYATMSGFGSQRVKGTVKSIMVDDDIVKVNLSLYDTDGLEGLYVPSSQFRETTKDVGSGALSNTSTLTNSTSTGGGNLASWGAQAVTNAVQKTSNAISKAIKKNSAKLKYGNICVSHQFTFKPERKIIKTYMIMKTIKKICALVVCALASLPSMAQQTYQEMEQLTINENVTTVITASEPVRFVDISTDAVVGDQPINNTIRLKPKEGAAVHADGDILAIVTIVTERYRTQYALIYTTRMQEAVTDKQILASEKIPYHNPSVSMSTEDMTRYARKIWNSSAKIRNVSTKQHRMTMRLNNIYSVGEYFFIDFSIENRTNIRFDIDEMRIKLNDKKVSKATNAQMIELTPAMVLDQSKTFKYGYRNVLVLKKMTFPNDKVLTIEISEKQISGRTINLDIDYEDVLYADSFNSYLMMEE